MSCKAPCFEWTRKYNQKCWTLSLISLLMGSVFVRQMLNMVRWFRFLALIINILMRLLEARFIYLLRKKDKIIKIFAKQSGQSWWPKHYSSNTHPLIGLARTVKWGCCYIMGRLNHITLTDTFDNFNNHHIKKECLLMLLWTHAVFGK